jgi:hypothetical protein
MVAATLAMMAAPLFAQESTEQLKKELEQLRAEVDGLKAVNQTKEIPASGKIQADAMAADDNPVMTLFKQTKLSGFVDAGYVVSFNHLSVAGSGTNNVGQNPMRLFDDRANSFYLNAVQLNLERLATKDMIVGYHLELAAGHDPAIYDAGNVALQEGWVQIMAPLGSGLDIRVGKMAKLAGYEVLESVNDFNYSRGMLFSFVQPFTTTGIRMEYNITEMFSTTIGFNNGFNRAATFEDNDHGKAIELQFLVKPVKDAWVAATLQFGSENGTTGSTNDKVYLFDITGAFTMDKLTLALNVDWGSAQGAIGARRAAVSGLALYAKFQANDWFAQSLRVEYFSDHDGGGFGLGPVGGFQDSGTGSRVFEFTLTSEVKVAQQLILRFEIRHDDSNNHNFNRDGRGARGDNTVGFEAIMPF